MTLQYGGEGRDRRLPGWAPAGSGMARWPDACCLALAVTSVLGVGCAPRVGVRPEESILTVEAHLREAAAAEAHGRALAEAGAATASVEARATSAAAHRAAAKALEEREAAACAQVLPSRAQAKSLPVTVHKVEAIGERYVTSPAPAPMKVRPAATFVGARLTVHGDVTAKELSTLLACRVARARARGDGGADPVEVQGATFEVRPLEEGDLAVEIRAPSESGASEILRRARVVSER